MFCVCRFSASSFIDSTTCSIEDFVSCFSIAVRTARQFSDSPSWVWSGAISSMFFSAFFRALNFRKSQCRFSVFMVLGNSWIL